jgi:hypothetical protein
MSARSAVAARARRAKHLATRYIASVRARSLDDATLAGVAGALEPGEQRVWDGMGRADRAEAVAVVRAFDAACTDAEPSWRAAALLHDAGKQVSGYGTFGRVVATVLAAVAGTSRVRGWADGSRSLRARMGRYAAHDDLGAEMLRAAGARSEVVAWAGAHHRPPRWAATGIPETVCRALAEADGEV